MADIPATGESTLMQLLMIMAMIGSAGGLAVVSTKGNRKGKHSK